VRPQIVGERIVERAWLLFVCERMVVWVVCGVCLFGKCLRKLLPLSVSHRQTLPLPTQTKHPPSPSPCKKMSPKASRLTPSSGIAPLSASPASTGANATVHSSPT
jgi:hypothetical protein